MSEQALGRALPWLPFVFGTALMAAALGLEAIDPRSGSPWDVIEAPVFLAVVFFAGLILAREPRNSVGWLLAVMGLAFPVTIFEQRYAVVANDGVLALPGIGITAALAWTWILLFVIPIVLAFVVPTGRPLNQTWGRVLWVVTAFIVGLTLILAFGNPGLSATRGAFVTAANPIHVPALEPAYQLVVDGPVAGVTLPVLIVLAVAALVARFRRSSGVERQQLKWIVSGLGLSLCLTFLGLSSPLEGLLGLSPLPFTASLAIAILRYRLYDIDRLISRTVAYALMTAILGVVFVGLVIALQTLARPLTSDSALAVAASTLLVAALFGPLRRRVQTAVDRRFDRARYDAARVAEGFGARLRDRLDLDTVSAELVGTTNAALRPASASVWVRRQRS